MSNLNTLREYTEALQQYCRLVDEKLTGQNRSEFLLARKEIDFDYILAKLQPLLSELTEGAERVFRIVMDLKDLSDLMNRSYMMVL